MAEIIKKERIEIKNGQLNQMCKNAGTTIHGLSKNVQLSEVALHLFNKGKRTMTWDDWETVCRYLDSLKK